MTPEELKAIYASCNSWWEVAEAVNTQLAARDRITMDPQSWDGCKLEWRDEDGRHYLYDKDGHFLWSGVPSYNIWRCVKLTDQLAAAQAVTAMGRTCLWRLREERRAIVDAHGEIAVPAYLHRCIDHLEKFAKQPADTAALDAAIAAVVEPVRKFWQDTYETCKATLDAERAATKPLVDALEQCESALSAFLPHHPAGALARTALSQLNQTQTPK